MCKPRTFRASSFEWISSLLIAAKLVLTRKANSFSHVWSCCNQSRIWLFRTQEKSQTGAVLGCSGRFSGSEYDMPQVVFRLFSFFMRNYRSRAMHDTDEPLANNNYSRWQLQTVVHTHKRSTANIEFQRSFFLFHSLAHTSANTMENAPELIAALPEYRARTLWKWFE